jgi:putative phosphoesterase
MKLAFISDIHGNAIALDAVLKDIKERKIDKTFVLGDICYRGPEPQRSLDLVRSLNTDVIKGNADEWIVRGVREGEVPETAVEIMNSERDWTYAKVDSESVDYLEKLPEELHLEYNGVNIHAFHATPDSLFKMVQPAASDTELQEKMMHTNADIYIYAHIHKPFIRYIDGKCIINTGSVGLPFDGLNKASYLILDINESGYQTSIRRVDYRSDKVIEQFKASDYPNKELMIKMLSNASM